MNCKEYWSSPKCDNDKYNDAHEMLLAWKLQNGIQKRCCIHHRDDNAEVIKYNEEHYELWGFNEDGTFDEGKYVEFMTSSAHAKYHNGDGKSAMIGWTPSDETRKKMIESGKRKVFSETHRKHLSDSCKGELNGFYGKTHSEEQRKKWHETRSGVSWGTHDEESKHKISTKQTAYWEGIRKQFDAYKSTNPDSTLTILQFRSLLKTNSTHG